MDVEGQAHTLACWTAGAFGGDVVIGFETIGPVGRFDLERDVIPMVLVIGDPVQETQIYEVAKVLCAFDEVLFDIVLLQVHECRVFVTIFREQVEAVYLVCAVKESADFPGDALVQHTFADTEPVENFKRTFRPANGAAAHRHDVIVIEDNGSYPMLGKIDRHRKADGARADDGHGVTGFGADEARGRVVGKGGVIIGHRDDPS